MENELQEKGKISELLVCVKKHQSSMIMKTMMKHRRRGTRHHLNQKEKKTKMFLLLHTLCGHL